jgi:hypothetical protein
MGALGSAAGRLAEGEGAALGNLGTVNARLGRLPQAVRYQESALDIATGLEKRVAR